MLVFWHRPSEHQVALNVDGSSYGNLELAGYGGLIRDYQGSWISGFSGHVDYAADGLEVELLAIMHGLMVVWDLRYYKNVNCISDCKNALSLILDPIFLPEKYIWIINTIKELISRDWVVSFVHNYREANQCADFMAKLGATAMDCFGIFPKPPDCLASLLFCDATGIPYIRF